MSERNLTLMTDLYELTMMQGYFLENKKNVKVVFDGFYRKNPFGNGYAICCGLEQVIGFVDSLAFTEGDIEYLDSLGLFREEFLEYLGDFRFTGDIYAIPEGRVMFPREPFIKIKAPIIEAQLLESAILCIINHQSLIATKASRVVNAARGDTVMEFGLRRAQGPDAGIYGSRAAYIGGCTGTSNVLAGRMFDIPVMGTHGHCWIMSFDSEIEAFRAYAGIYPGCCTLLVDTYDVLKSGIPNAITVFGEMREAGLPTDRCGIRIDSGDLAYLSKKARAMLDEAGFPEVFICASNDLDENLITSLKFQGAKISSWGVGTSLVTADGDPSLGGVYKLVAVENEAGEMIPKIKLSENSEKITNPGDKEIYRIRQKDSGRIIADLIALTDEEYCEKDELLLFDPNETWKKIMLPGGSYCMEKLLVPVYKDGKCVYNDRPSVKDIQKLSRKELSLLWEESRRLVNPHETYVDLSKSLWDMKNQLIEHFSGKNR